MAKKVIGYRKGYGTISVGSLKAKTPKVQENVKRYVKTQLSRGVETQQIITNVAGTKCPYDSPILTDLCQMAQGDTEDDRYAENVNLVKFKLKGFIKRDGADSVARCTVVQWKADSTTDAPSLSDFFYQGGTTALSFYQNIRNDTTADGTYKVLYDKRFNIESVGPNSHLISFSTSNLIKKCNFNDNALTGRNHIFIIFTSENTAVSGFAPKVYYDAEVHYKDN